ncbi:hypothetical protein KC887_02050 [Candidatus Kaiserbacteria bacterium]|nr:hypothetical protein [Candidatus Kaiserbacteria bacterium]
MADYAVALTSAGQGIKCFGPSGTDNVSYEIDFESELSGTAANFYVFDGRSGASTLYLLINSSGKIQFDAAKFAGADIDGVPQSWTSTVTPFVGSGLDTIAGKTLRIYHNGATLGGSYNGSFFIGSRYNSIDTGVMQVSGIRALVSGSPVSSYLMNEGSGSALTDSLATYSDGILVNYTDDSQWVLLGGGSSTVDVSSTDMMLTALFETNPITLERTVTNSSLALTPSLGISALTLSRTVNNDPLTVTPILSQSAMIQTVGAGSSNMVLAPSLGSNTVALTVTVGNNDLTAVTYFDTHSISIAGISVVDVSSSSMTLTPLLDPSSISLSHSVVHADMSLPTALDSSAMSLDINALSSGMALVAALDSSAMSLVINTLSSDMLVTAIFESSTFGSAIFYGSSDMRLDTQLDDHNISSAINLLNSDIMVLPFFDSSGITRSVSVVNENMYVVTRLESSSFTTLNFMDVDSHTIHLQSLSIEYQIESLTVNYMVIEG